jgi:hypothetical protein
MRLLLESRSLALLVTVLLLVGLSRFVAHGEEAPTIVPLDDPPTISTETTTTADKIIKSSTTTTSALSFLKDCRRAGFDPMQLACTTCAILPNNEQHQSKCRECCQSYKTLEKRSKRYEMAILLNTGFPEAVRELVRDDTDGILEQKGSTRFHVQDFGSANADNMGGMMGMMGMFQQEPSAILWFDTPINLDDVVSTDELATEADEITVLSGRGLGRDDIRDMLLALLPDKE